MADRKPLKLNAGVVAEFASGDTLGVALGGTGATAASQARINLGISNTVTIPFILENGTTDDIVLDGTGAVTSLSGVTNIDLTLDGTFTITGTAGFKDLVTDISVRGAGASNPAWVQISGNDYGYAFPDNQIKECWATIHINHDYKPGGSVFAHVHFQLAPNPGSGTIRWGFEYWIAKGHSQGASSKFSTQTGTVYVEKSSDTVSEHYIAEMSSAFDTARLEPDTVIKLRVFRDTASPNDSFTGNAYVITIDAHYEADRFATKNRSPNFYV